MYIKVKMKKKVNRSPSPSPTEKSKSKSTRKGFIQTIRNLFKTKKKNPPKVSMKSIVALKRVINRRATRKAAKNRTFAFNQLERVALGLVNANNRLPPPPGFKGTVKQKYERALTYRNRLTQFSKKHPQFYDRPLYRGVTGDEFLKFFNDRSPIVHKPNMSSFSKNYNVAVKFAKRIDKYKGPHRGIVLLEPSMNKVPSINYTTGYFKSHYQDESEVLLPPGKFYKIRFGRDFRYNLDVVYVSYKAD